MLFHVAALVLLSACGTGGGASPAATVAAVTTPPAAAEAAVPPGFRNEDGQLACPVMGDTVASAEDSAGYADYKGVRYYFCCNSCEILFNEDPEKYAEGHYLQEIGAMHGTDAGACSE